MKKRILCIFLTVCMLFALATPALAAETIESGQCGNNLNWSLTSDGTLTISGAGDMWDYEYGEDMRPTSPWYKYWASDLGTELKALVISDGVTSIGNYAFMNCKSFTGTLLIPNSVTSIGQYAFYSCNGFDGGLTLPKNVVSIGNNAFFACRGFTGILTIPASITMLGDHVFYNAENITRIHFDGNAPEIGNNTFSGNVTLEVPTSGTGWTVPTWNGYTTEWYTSETVTSGSCGDNLTWTLDSDGTLTISGTGAMWDWGDNFVADPSPWRVYADQLKTLVIRDGVTHIGNNAFSGCEGLTGALILPDSIASIGKNAFRGCGFTGDVTFSKNIRSIGVNAFASCSNLGNAYFEGNAPEISADGTSFAGITLYVPYGNTSWTVPTWNRRFHTAWYTPDDASGEDVSVVAEGSCGNDVAWTLDSTGLLTIEGTGEMWDYGQQTGDQCPWVEYGYGKQIQALEIKEGVTHIGDNAFLNISFHEITELSGSLTIPSSVTSIGINAFAGCSGFTGTLILPSSITSIGKGAFIGCSGFTGTLTIPSRITSISDFTFAGCSGVNCIELPESVISIGESAFNWCNNLSEITIPNDEVSISFNVFKGCENLKDIYFGGTKEQWIASGGSAGITEAGINPTIHYAGELQTKNASGVLRSGEDWSINWSCIYMEDDSGNISNGALTISASGTAANEDLYIFNGSSGGFPWESAPYNIPKTAITSLVIRGTSTITLRVATNSFQEYDALKTIACSYLSGIDSGSFMGCDLLQTVNITTNVSQFISYGANVFADCSNLSSVTFPKSLQYINAGAFRNTALGTITLDEGLVEIGAGAFSGCDKLIIRCYKDSVAHQYAVSNKIPFKLMSEGELEATVPLSNGDKTIYLDIHWDPDKMFSGKSGIYDNNLAIAGLALSAASEGGLDEINETLTAMGFLEDPRSNDNYAESGGPGISMPAHSIASMPIIIDGQEKTLITLVVRGTDFASDDFWTDIKALGDGFADSGTYVFESVCDYIDRNYANDDVILFVTGHSLGGAVAGVVADLCSHRYSDANVFSYTFATPNNSYTEISRSNVHNIINACDLVPALPPNYNEIGTNYYYTSKSNPTFIEKYLELFDTFPDQNPFNLIVNHLTDTYMALLLSDTPLSSTEEYGYRLVRILCPVDVKVYDSTETLVGSVVNNEVDPSLLTTEVFIETYGDEKYIYLFNDEEYSFELIGTGTGTMTYSVQDIAIDGTILEEKSYQNVVLSNGKEMASNVGGTTNTPDIHLYVLGEDGEPTKIVLPDGNGTEISITPTEPSEPTYPTGGGGTTPSYSISVPADFTGGSVAVTPSHASAGSTVIIAVTPEDGYVLDQLKVTDANGDELVLTDKGNGNYSFTMPSKRVNVEVSFKEIPKNPFTDVTTDSWFYDAAMFVYERGLMNGIDADLFGPDIATTRGMLVTILWRQDGAPEAIYDGELNDVPDTMYYAPAVKWAAANGIMGGYGNGKFGPDDPITREQMAAILWRYAQYKGYDTSVTEDSISDFNDVLAISDYAAPAMQWVCSEGIMSGKPSKLLDPNGTAKRSEIATMLMRFLENVK